MKNSRHRSVQHQSKLAIDQGERAKQLRVAIHDMTHDGRGVGKIDGKTVFVAGALIDELVDVQVVHQKSQYFEARLVAVIEPSAHRISPHCQHFGTCGGCQLQHLSSEQQVTFKQNQLARSLAKAGVDCVKTEWQAPLTADTWHYRRRARWALNRQGQLCYRAIGGKYLVPIQQCPQLSQPLMAIFQQLSNDLDKLPRTGIEEIECLVIGNPVLVLHTNHQWREHQATPWLRWSEAQNIQGLALQSSERDSALVVLRAPDLHYQLDDIQFHFSPDQFVQTHEMVNQQMVALAKTWLAAGPTDKVLELFCGMGNFSLPIAQGAESLLGLELNDQSIATAKANALANNIVNTTFAKADLFAVDWRTPMGMSHVLLDPPWDGAAIACERLAKNKHIKRIVYVSCHPATMARDIAVLQKAKFKVAKMAMIDQFPQSYHVEAMALLIRE